jgi:uncharacterized protein involved in exopolysaccharide biosynthesis
MPEQSSKKQRLSAEEEFRLTMNSVRPHFNKLKENRKKFLWINVSIAVLTIIILYFGVSLYFESSVTILPEYGNKNTNLGQISDLAALAGVKVGEGAPTEIYQVLVTSESVLEPVIYKKYSTKEFKDSVNLVQYFDIKPDNSLSPKLQQRKMFIKAYKKLCENHLSTDLDRITKVLDIKVTLPESELSALVANNIVESLDYYIRTKRKSYASEQRFYIEKRLLQVKDSLSSAENKLKNFREENRLVASPALLLEQGRLLRNVDIMQTVYIELNKQLEIAKIDEIKETPVLNVKELAKDPIIKAGPKRGIIFVIIIFTSVLLSSLYFMFRDELKIYYRIVKGSEKIEPETHQYLAEKD